MKRFLRTAALCLLATAALALNGSMLRAETFAGYTPKSDDALRLAVELGKGATSKTLLLVLDESKGTGKGFDVAIADLNLDGKLSDEKPIENKNALGALSNRQIFEIAAKAPFGDVDPEAVYTLSPYLYKTGDKYALRYMAATIQVGKEDARWTYTVLGQTGKPDKEDPGLVRYGFGTPVTIEADTTLNGGEIRVSSMIRDGNGQTLRTVQHGDREYMPHLKVTDPAGKVFVDKDLSYG